MRARINLFRQVKRGGVKAPSANLKALKEIKLGFAFLYGVGLLTTFLSVVIVQYRAYRHQLDEVNAHLAESLAKFDEGLKELERKKAAQAAREKEALLPKKVAEKPAQTMRTLASANIDSSWSSVLWKLSTITIQPVVIQNMELTSIGAARQVNITGSAESLSDFRRWLETLHYHLPASDFVVENHGQVADRPGEINFKLTAKIS